VYVVEQKIDIACPKETVWAYVSQMEKMSQWVRPILGVSLEPAVDQPSPGIVRRIEGPLGWVGRERFTAWTPLDGYRYQTVDEPWPTKNYESWFTLRESPQGCSVCWGGQFDIIGGFLPAMLQPVISTALGKLYGHSLWRLKRILEAGATS